MEGATIRRNFIYSSVLIVSTYLIPLFVFPYVSRILGVNNIGICGFVDSIISYYILFSMMGIGILGIREVAKAKDDMSSLFKVFQTLFSLNFLTTVFSIFILFISIFFIDKFNSYKDFLFIGIIKLFFNFLLIEWFYKGMEDFKYISIRSIIVKLSYCLMVFLLIKDKNDVGLYYLLSALMFLFNALFNIFYLKKYIPLKYLYKFNFNQCRIYLKSYFSFGVYLILTSSYITLNVAFLGFVASDKEVGYYSTAVKIYSILIGFFTAFTGVMLPRMSSLIHNNDWLRFKDSINKSFEALFCFAAPILIISILYTSEIIYIIAGKGYSGAVWPMKILMPLIFIIGYEQIIVVQILMPLNRDKAVFINAIVGAFVGIILNIILVPKLYAVGSACVWLIAELSVLISAQYFIYKYVRIHFPFRLFIKTVAFSFPIIILCIFVKMQLLSYGALFSLLVSSLLVSVYFIFLWVKIFKITFVVSFFNDLKMKVQNLF